MQRPLWKAEEKEAVHKSRFYHQLELHAFYDVRVAWYEYNTFNISVLLVAYLVVQIPISGKVVVFIAEDGDRTRSQNLISENDKKIAWWAYLHITWFSIEKKRKCVGERLVKGAVTRLAPRRDSEQEKQFTTCPYPKAYFLRIVKLGSESRELWIMSIPWGFEQGGSRRRREVSSPEWHMTCWVSIRPTNLESVNLLDGQSQPLRTCPVSTRSSSWPVSPRRRLRRPKFVFK